MESRLSLLTVGRIKDFMGPNGGKNLLGRKLLLSGM